GVGPMASTSSSASRRRRPCASTVDLEAKAKASFEAAPKDGKVRRFTEFLDSAASWSRVERIIARVEAGAGGPDTRFAVTNLEGRNPRALYEEHLAADRTSCTKATANQ